MMRHSGISVTAKLTLTQNHDGTLGLRGVLDKESGALALAVLGPLAAPAAVTEGLSDMRFPGQRYADAFVQLCQLATPALPDVRGERPHLLVTTTLEAFSAKLGAYWAPSRVASTSARVQSAGSRAMRT
jgi:Domain of unknown function (DUF222)